MGSPPDRFDDLYAAGRAKWPEIALDQDRFAQHVASLATDGAPQVDRAADLYLACACALGVAGAVEAFERTYATDIERTVARVNKDVAFVRDATQAVRERLLIARPDAPPRIVEYGGRAALRAWLASAATRVALNMRRGKAEQPHEELRSNANMMIANATAPELAVLRARYKDDFEEAIKDALRALPSRERAILRLHLAERTSIDGLATIYGIGRSTAARWLAAAREQFLDNTRAIFCKRAGIASAEFDSIAAALRSDLDMSLVTHLASTTGD